MKEMKKTRRLASPANGILPYERLLRDLHTQAKTLAELERAVTSQLEKARQELPEALPDVQIPAQGVHLSARERETLVGLLSGNSEKEIANNLGVSRNTVHVYVKHLHAKHDATSRGELLSRYISPRVFATLRTIDTSTAPSPSAAASAESPSNHAATQASRQCPDPGLTPKACQSKLSPPIDA